MTYRIATVSDVGNVREKNEDSVLVCRRSFGRREAVLAAVADGMGGLNHGDWASRCAVDCLRSWWDKTVLAPPDLSEICDLLGFAVETAHAMIRSEMLQRKIQMGTTLSLVFLWERDYVAFQVGDSRIYLLGKQMVQLTRDQTWCQLEVEAGRMTPEEASVHEKRHVLSNALGSNENFYVEHFRGRMRRRERLLLCSDGYYSYLRPEELRPGRLRGNVQEAMERSGQRIGQGSAEDNFSAVLIEAR